MVGRAPYALVAALIFVRFADEWFTFFPDGLLVPIRNDLRLSYSQAGILIGALGAGGILGHGFTVAADYVSRRLLASLGALGFGLCMIAFGLGHSFVVLLVASVLWGAASDAFVHGCEVALIDLAGDDLVPALARVNTLGAVGDLLGPLMLAGGAAIGVSWRVFFLAGGALMIAYALLLGCQRFPPPRPPEHARTPLAGVWAVLRDRRVIALAVVDGLFGLLDEPFLAFIIAWLERVRGHPPATATLIATAAVAGGLVGYASVERIAGRFRPRSLLLASGAAIAVAVGALLVAPAPPLQAVTAAAFGISGALFYSVLQVAYLGLRPGQAGATQAVVSTIGLAGFAFPALVGAVSDHRGLTTGLSLYVAVPVVMVAILAAAPGATRVGRPTDDA